MIKAGEVVRVGPATYDLPERANVGNGGPKQEALEGVEISHEATEES
jgi:hypothetical protein